MSVKQPTPNSQAEMVRVILNEKGDITPTEIVQAATERGWELTIGNANQQKSKWKKSNGKPVTTRKRTQERTGTPEVTGQATDFGTLKSAFKFAMQCGGVEQARTLLEQVEKKLMD